MRIKKYKNKKQKEEGQIKDTYALQKISKLLLKHFATKQIIKIKMYQE